MLKVLFQFVITIFFVGLTIKLPFIREVVDDCMNGTPEKPRMDESTIDKKILTEIDKYYDGMGPGSDHIPPEKAKKVYKYKRWQTILSCWFNPSLPLCKYTPINSWSTIFDNGDQVVLSEKSGKLVPRLTFKFKDGDWMLVKYSVWGCGE